MHSFEKAYIHTRNPFFQFPFFLIKFHINWITFFNSLFWASGFSQFPFRASGFYRGNNGWEKPLITQIKYNKVDTIPFLVIWYVNSCSFGPNYIVSFFGLVVFIGEISGGDDHL
jgi:hypothetical protein